MTEPDLTPFSEPARPPLSARRALLLIAALIAAGVGVAILGIIPRVRARAQLQVQTDALATPEVQVETPHPGAVTRELVLPGNVQAFTESPIYARTSGYLKSWSADLGAHVKKGQRLAVIASPEVDQQLAQARADLATAEASQKLAETQSARYQELLQQNAVSKQDTDNFRAQASTTSNQVHSATANVRRLSQMTAFENVVAPFDGVITARNVDVGTLVDAGAGRELFHLADDGRLRVYVSVPQADSRACVPGLPAGLTVPELPGRVFEGQIVRTANAIDPTYRTLLVEVDVDNHQHELFPGAYGQVHFKLSGAPAGLVIPVTTLIFRSEGLRVAVVEGDKVRLRPITVRHDDGKSIEVSDGLRPTDRVVLNPPDALVDGEVVRVVAGGAAPR
jgi:RND family efflux transporter MFP subunit